MAILYLLHEPGFDGILSAVAWGLRRQVIPDGFFSTDELPVLVPCQPIPVEPGIRQAIRQYLRPLLGEAATAAVLDNAWRASLSEQAGIGRAIDAYIRHAVRMRADPIDLRQEPLVLQVAAAVRRVGGQAHHYLGLLRFRNLGRDLYLADLAPDYHVLPLIVPHFADRLTDQSFVIRDCRRLIAALHPAHGRCHYVRLSSLEQSDPVQVPPDPGLPFRGRHQPVMPLPAGDAPAGLASGLQAPGDAQAWADLWQRYLERLSIPGRENRALQQSHLPRKYWPYLTEEPDR